MMYVSALYFFVCLYPVLSLLSRTACFVPREWPVANWAYRGKNSSRNVAMVEKCLDLNKPWSWKYVRRKRKIDMYDFNFLCMIALRNKLTRKIVEIHKTCNHACYHACYHGDMTSHFSSLFMPCSHCDPCNFFALNNSEKSCSSFSKNNNIARSGVGWGGINWCCISHDIEKQMVSGKCSWYCLTLKTLIKWKGLLQSCLMRITTPVLW